MRNFNNYINESKSVNKINKTFNKMTKLIDEPFYKKRLELNISYYFNIYSVLFENTDLQLNDEEINLLILSSMSRILNDKKSNIDILENEIRKSNIHELYKSSLIILNTIYSILLIVKKSVKDIDILFTNRFFLSLIYDYLNNKKINMYDFNSSFRDGLSSEIINFIKQN